ncbi:MAG: response regulator, partial [Cytophagales bacterium]|nr:response regulator [Cytophaga sp.]
AFGKKNEASKEDSIAGNNMNIELFSYTYKKQDTLVTDTLVKLQSFSQDNRKKVKNVIRENLEFDTIYNLKRLAIIEKDFAIRDRISSQIKVIQAREQADAQDNILAIQNISAKTINKIFWIFLIILFACLCLYILLVLDAYRVKRYEERLILEKKNYQNLANNRAQFLSMMAHELRTPLQSIIGFSELLEETQKSSSNKSSQYSEIIKKSSSHLLQTINLLLDRSKIDAGKLELEYISFNLSECIHDVFESLSIQAGEKRISYVLQSDIPKDLFVYSDSFRLKQVLYNLLNNAIKFTNAGTVKLMCFANHHEDQASIQFEVSDTGIGIAEHKLKHLFEEYNQLDKSTGRLYGGTGLGLVITKKILELFSSNLSVKSEAESGTTFLFDIDFAKSYSLPVKNSNDINLSGINILIVDDDSYNLLYTHQLLNNYSLSVTLASTIEEAIHQITETKPNVILCDLYINESLGTDLLPHVHDDTALIFMSADHEHLNDLKEQHYHTLAKPFTIYALLSELSSLAIDIKKPDTIEINTGTELDSLHLQSLSEKLTALERALNEGDAEEIIYYLHQLKTTFGYLNRWEEIKMIQKTESSYTLYAKDKDLFTDVSNMLASWNEPYSN